LVVIGTLFVTLAKPLPQVTPSEVDWLRRATDWGAGLTLDTPESDAIEQIQQGLYEYGAKHWRYGYGGEVWSYGDGGGVESKAKTFNTIRVMSEEQAEEYRITCWNKGEDNRRCKCPWFSLVAEDTACFFSDCYVFSRVLENISATMGIGVFEPIVFKGTEGQGYVTGQVSSFDRWFDSNIDCEPDDDSCPRGGYTFTSHSLLERDEEVFDATFNLQYQSEEDSAAMSILEREPWLRFVMKDKTSVSSLMVKGDRGYGNWRRYNWVSGEEAGILNFMTELAGAMERDQGSIHGEMLPEVRFHREPRDGRPPFETLVVDVEVKIPDGFRPNHDLVLAGQLLNAADDSKTIADKPVFQVQESTSADVANPGSEEVQVVSLTFSGEQIYRAATDGPWALEIVLTDVDEEEPVAFRRILTDPFKFKDFGADGVSLEAVTVDGPFMATDDPPHLELTVALAVRKKGTFHVVARLERADRSISYAGNDYRLGDTLSSDSGPEVQTREVTLSLAVGTDYRPEVGDEVEVELLEWQNGELRGVGFTAVQLGNAEAEAGTGQERSPSTQG
jgi:hypothetical protein